MQKQADGIYRSVSHIENSLTDALSIDELAGRSYFSRTHFQRLFRSVVGEPVMEYIKKRRLQQACRVLGESDATVLDVAVAYGYDSYEGFSRAFKAYFGMSPTRYRNVRMVFNKEEKEMLFHKLKGNVDRHIKEVIRVLQPITADCKALAQSAEEAGKATGPQGGSTLILAAEYGGLANRTIHFISELEDSVTATEQTVFDMSDRIYRFVKMMDDVAFQFNVLRLFSAAETARIDVNPGSIFHDVDEKLDKLLHQAMESRSAVIRLLDELTLLVREEIRTEAVSQRDAAAELLQKVASDGKVLVADAKGAALSFGEYGHAYMCVAKDLEKRVGSVNEAAQAMKGFTGERGSVDDALKKMDDASFMTNINAFNAKIETARSGYNETLKACTERILQYPQQMHEANAACVKALDESVKLFKLAKRSTNHEEMPAEEKFQRSIEDIFFQTEILLAQMRVETERCRVDTFRPAADKIEGALKIFSDALDGTLANDKAAVARFNAALSEIIVTHEEAIAEAGVRGLVHKVFASEFGHLAKRIEALLTYV
ncbi:MAG: helix-turn-helix domain-containing protein [Defluviitaleaceae bacterium]|nr:helix-turn-helix domain-containing protein [Defluviitaleaceae bacterium]